MLDDPTLVTPFGTISIASELRYMTVSMAGPTKLSQRATATCSAINAIDAIDTILICTWTSGALHNLESSIARVE